MKKSKKLITISTIIIGSLVILYLSGIVLNKQKLDIPKKSDILFIELYKNNTDKYHVVEGNNNITEIYDSLLAAKKSRNKESVNDTPNDVNGDFIKILLTDSAKNITILFVYEDNDGNYYVEKPYEGIYKICVKEYEVFTQYFIASSTTSESDDITISLL